MTVEVIRSPALGAVPHGFLGRSGGVSTGDLAGLNIGYGSNDDRAAIDENRRRAIAAVLPAAELVTVHQIHSADVVYVERSWPRGERPHADAMVTDRPGLLLGILTADCAPVLFADAEAGVIGAAHAGWRGALAGVTDSTIAAMEKLGARRDRIRAAIGPCIGQASYEVDEDFRLRFLSEDSANERFFVPGPRGNPISTSPAMSRTGSVRPGSWNARRSASTPTPSPTDSTATAALPIAARPITADKSALSACPPNPLEPLRGPA